MHVICIFSIITSKSHKSNLTSNHLHFCNLSLAVSGYLSVHINSVAVFSYVVKSVSDVRAKSGESRH